MLRASLVGAALALLAVPAATPATGDEPVLALVSSGTHADLVRLDPVSLAPVPGGASVAMGLQDIPWASSPDGWSLAVGSGRTTSLVFVDLRSMRRVGRVPTAFTTALAWPKADRLVLLERVARRWRFALVHPTQGVLSRTPLGAGWYVVAAARSTDGLVLLTASERRVGRPRLLLLDADGRARRVPIPRLDAGQRRKRSGERFRLWYRHPGLAVDTEGRRAYVVTAGLRVAIVDLDTLAVSVRTAQAVSRRSAATAEPGLTARARSGGNVLATGTQRQAHWLPSQMLAVSGWDARVSRDRAGKPVQHEDTAGLTLVDTRTWTARRLVEDTRWFHVTDDSVLVQVPPRRLPGTALLGFSHDGGERFRLDLDGVYFGIQSAGGYAYLGLADRYRPHTVVVLDARTGEQLGGPEAPGWVLLLSPSQPQFCWCSTSTTVG